MFRNCFTFHVRDSQIYKYAKKLEERLDQLLQVWAPEFFQNPLIDIPKMKGKRSAGDSQQGADNKRRRRQRSAEGSDSSSDLVTEQEREDRDYQAAIAQSMADGDFDISLEVKTRGKGRGRGRGRK